MISSNRFRLFKVFFFNLRKKSNKIKIKIILYKLANKRLHSQYIQKLKK